ncbi:MAG: type IV pilus secretin PilQ [Elusimicrobiales bacterium]|jgi:type IV pilus secretin PilQ/predicted competence protein
MKKITVLIMIALLSAQNPVFIYAAENALVKSVRVSSESVYITTDKPVKYKSFMMSRPARLIVELENSRLGTLQEIPVNGTFIGSVRTGQFKAGPSGVSRVVLELTQKAVYDITQKGTELVVVVGGKFGSKTPALKDAPAAPEAVPAGVKIIAPTSQDKSQALPDTELVKPADLDRESVPVILPKKSAPSRAEKISRNIMDNLPTEPVNLDYTDVEIRDIIGMLAAKAGINIIYSDDVTGTTSINLNKVPFDEAFKTILNVNGFAAQQVGDNILRIAAPQTFLAEQKKAYLQTRVFFLNYSKAADVKVQLDAVAAAEVGQGKYTVDESNNALIVTDSAMGLENTARLIRNLDRIPRQVVIEAKLVEVSLDDSLDLGVQWGYTSKNGSNTLGRTLAVDGYDFAGQKAIKVPAPGTPLQAGSGVDLAANNIFGALRLGRVTASNMLDLTIQAAAKKGKAKVLSNPKIATLNNKEANINITNQTPYTTTEITNGPGGSVTTQKITYITTGIILRVTPTINSDGRISMKINPQVSQPSQAALFAAPSVDTRSADTSVIVKNGETIVIGGLIHDSQSDTISKVPLLGDIPLLGYLFRKKAHTRTRVELLIFVTPRVLEE